MTDQPKPDAAAARRTLLKLGLEVGPVAVFFVGNAKFGIFPATAAFMAAMVVALAVSWAMFRKLAVLPVVSAVFVLIFGGLTLYLQDDLFIKLKPTIVNALFAAILFGGLAMGKPLLKMVLGDMVPLTEAAWGTLTFRWAAFFVLLAVLNEVVWRNFSTEFWIAFKLFGIMPLTLVFALAQTPLMLRGRPADQSEDGVEGSPQ